MFDKDKGVDSADVNQQISGGIVARKVTDVTREYGNFEFFLFEGHFHVPFAELSDYRTTSRIICHFVNGILSVFTVLITCDITAILKIQI